METLLNISGLFLVLSFIWFIVSFIVYMWITSDSKYWEKLTKKIYLSKSKTYKGRISPIYELVDNDYGDEYYIDRYSLKYNQVYAFPSIFLFYPVKFYKWGYSKDESLYICSTKTDIEKTLNGKTIKEFYEMKMKVVNEKWEKNQIKTNKINVLIEEQNKEFNENYIE